MTAGVPTPGAALQRRTAAAADHAPAQAAIGPDGPAAAARTGHGDKGELWRPCWRIQEALMDDAKQPFAAVMRPGVERQMIQP